jgi:hypothetical protein
VVFKIVLIIAEFFKIHTNENRIKTTENYFMQTDVNGMPIA